MNDMAESYGGTTDGKPFDHAEWMQIALEFCWQTRK